MTRIPRNVKPKVIKPLENIVNKKINPVAEKTIKPSSLERTPVRDFFFDYSTESSGYFTKKEAKTGRVLEVFPLMFPR